MPVNDFETINDAGQISAREFERLGETVKAQAKIVGSQGLIISQNSGGFQVATQDPLVFFAKVTGHAAGTPAPHAWTQQRQNSDGTLADDTEGNAGTTTYFPAYSTDGGVIPTNTIVRLYLSVGGDYYLVYPSPSGATGSMLEVKESDGSPDVLNVTTLIVDQATGLAIESGATPTVTLQCLSASLTQIGVVNLSDQVMGNGTKTFSKNVKLPDAAATPYGELIWGTSSILSGADSGPFGLPVLYYNNGLPTGVTSAYWATYMANDGITVVFALPYGTDYLGQYSCNGLLGTTGTGLGSVDVEGGIVVAGSAGMGAAAAAQMFGMASLGI